MNNNWSIKPLVINDNGDVKKVGIQRPFSKRTARKVMPGMLLQRDLLKLHEELKTKSSDEEPWTVPTYIIRNLLNTMGFYHSQVVSISNNWNTQLSNIQKELAKEGKNLWYCSCGAVAFGEPAKDFGMPVPPPGWKPHKCPKCIAREKVQI